MESEAGTQLHSCAGTSLREAYGFLFSLTEMWDQSCDELPDLASRADLLCKIGE